MTGKIIKVLIIIVLLTSTTISAQKDNNIGLLTSTNISYHGKSIEIFDINESRMVKVTQSNARIQKEVESYLNGITGPYLKFRPIPDKGFMVRIPLEPGIEVQNQWLAGPVDEVIIIFPEEAKPYLLVFDAENKPLFFIFEGKTEALLKQLNYHPKKP